MGERSSEVEILGVSKDGAPLNKVDELVHEEQIIVKLNRQTQTFYCIPVDLEEMIAGNLKSRGIDPSSCHIRRLSSSEFEVDVREQPAKTPRRCDSKKRLTSHEVLEAVERLDQSSFLYRRTGCTHVVGIRRGREVFVEDISRHCAIDKAIGLAMRDGIDLSGSCLVTSCRQTASTVSKAVYCQIPIVISIAAPTDPAMEEANRYGITLIGFASSQRFNIYSHDWRIEIQ